MADDGGNGAAVGRRAAENEEEDASQADCCATSARLERAKRTKVEGKTWESVMHP